MLKNHLEDIIFIVILIGLYFTRLYSFLLFHTISELFSIVIGISIFIIAWNTKKYTNNDYFTFIGIAYLFISGIDLIHTLAYKGMNIFIGYTANLPTQLWILARYAESISLFVSPIFITKKLDIKKIIATYLLVLGFFITLIFTGHFPFCYIEGKGLTQFKIVSEYVISVILLFSLFMLYKRRDKFDNYIYKLVSLSILITIGGEIVFTTYFSVYGFSNMLGHYFKVISFFLLYKALIASNLENPLRLLFKELKQSEDNYSNLFNKMLNAFALHEMLYDDKGIPINYRFLQVNPEFERITGLKANKILGKTVLEILPKTEKYWIETYGKVSIEEKPIRFSNYSRELNKYFDVYAFSPEKGKFATIFFDITERKLNEEKIKNLNDSLRILNKILRHDILNDLTVVMNALDMAKSLDPPIKNSALKAIDKSINLIDRIRELESSLIIDGKLKKVKIRDTISEIIKNYEKIDFIVNGDCEVMADDALIPLIDNILRNAVVHGGTNRIDIDISCKYDTVEIRIIDYGKGIPDEIKEKIFEEGFSYGKTGGTGLGLYIVKKTIERYGGSIEVQDTKPHGATFILRLNI